MKIKVFLIFPLIILLFGCGYYQSLTHDYPYLSDSVLTEFFIEQKNDFNILIKMFIEDSKTKNQHYWIGRDEEFTFRGLSSGRRYKYRELMYKLDILSIGRNYEEPEIIYLTVISNYKDIDNGEVETDRKGYSYSPETVPPRLIEFGETDFFGVGYKKIDEDWYIFHETRSGRPD